MENLVNRHQPIFTPVKEGIWKLSRQSLPIALHLWKNLWMPLNKSEASREGTQKLVPQTDLLGFVPLERFGQLVLGLWRNRDPITHGF